MPQLLFRKNAGNLVLVVPKIVDDLKEAIVEHQERYFPNVFDSCFKLGTIYNGPGKLRGFGINTTQDNNSTILTDVNDTLEDIM